ncbi:MAG: radical SAM protein [Nitrospinae bacterium CG11_big_fil_rev_8_21_14_0_20_56_8]|nr:MAG: radical SAM protein [Nitrospinae bacterium CG11_big_fil_rev_8_21_14_0_20_56_8]
MKANSSLPPTRVLLVYPNTADVAMDNLGFQRVHSLLNQIGGVVCDRFALPPNVSPYTPAVRSEQLRSFDLGLRPLDFDIIAFSISYEPDYLNAVSILQDFKIPLRRRDRGESYPLVLAGGSAIFINPEPLAEIMDGFFIGEAERLVERFFELWFAVGGKDRDAFLKFATAISGMYLPEFYEARFEGEVQVGLDPRHGAPSRVDRHWVPEGADLCTHSVVHEGVSTFNSMALMEVTRGCIWACRFCTAGFIYRPPRLPDLEKTYDSLDRLLREQGEPVTTIGLLGPSVTDHPALLPLARRITEQGKTLSFSSLRMETLTEELVDLILKSGQKTLTVAVDGPSERMRKVINKAADDDFIVDKCRFLTAKGILNLKIYSIIGLPGETDEDIDRFIHLVERVMEAYVEASRPQGRIGKVTISLSPLVPKPGTPFQWHPMEPVFRLKKKFMRVRKALGRLPHLKMSFGSPNEAYLQTYLSRGDRRLISFFESYLNLNRDAKSALQTVSPPPDSFVYRQYGGEEFLAWDIIDHGYRNHFLWDDYQRGLREAMTPICDTAVCKICGIC